HFYLIIKGFKTFNFYGSFVRFWVHRVVYKLPINHIIVIELYNKRIYLVRNFMDIVSVVRYPPTKLKSIISIVYPILIGLLVKRSIYIPRIFLGKRFSIDLGFKIFYLYFA